MICLLPQEWAYGSTVEVTRGGTCLRSALCKSRTIPAFLHCLSRFSISLHSTDLASHCSASASVGRISRQPMKRQVPGLSQLLSYLIPTNPYSEW